MKRTRRTDPKVSDFAALVWRLVCPPHERPPRSARRLAADPVDLHRRRRPGRPAARGGVGRGPRASAPAARRSWCRSATATRSSSASCAAAPRRRADRPDLRPLRRPGRRATLSAWTSPPFEPEVRDGRLYARGAGDDKGNFWPLLSAACDLARAGELPVNVRVVVEGEEEAGSESIAEWIRADERGADAAIVFDSGMVDEQTPAITVGLRGLAMAQIEVRTGVRDLHSGIYGGSVLNALHVLHHMLAAGRARPRRRAARGAARRRPAARRGRADLLGAPAARRAGPLRGRRPPGLSRARRPSTTSATARTPRSRSTRSSAASRARSCPPVARATVSLRLAPGQRVGRDRRRCSSACCATPRPRTPT